MPAMPLKLGLASFVRVPSEGATRVSAGSVASTVQVVVAGVASVLPAASVARTRKVCAPGVSPERTSGDEQAVQAPASRRHSKLAPVSLESKRKSADVVPVAAGGVSVKKVFGALVSTRKLWAALVP